MTTIIALFEHRASLDTTLAELRKNGFSGETMVLLDNVAAVQTRLDCSLRRQAWSDGSFAATLSIIIFGIFGLMAGMGSMQMGAGMDWALGTIVVFGLLGALFGLFIGSILGAAGAEQEFQLYLEGVRRGGALILVTTDSQRENKVHSILRQAGGLGLSTCGQQRTVTERTAAGESVLVRVG